MEYKFRGKRIDNEEWVYGSYHYCTQDGTMRYVDYKDGNRVVDGKPVTFNCHWILEHKTPDTAGWDVRDSFVPHAVIPETVGMWTGIKDIEGDDIYDGDIVLTKKFWKYRFSDNKRWRRFYGLVVFDVSQTTGEAGWDVEVKDQEDYDYEAYGPFDDCKVISNINDNPELLNPPKEGVLNMTTDPKEAEVKEQEGAGAAAAAAAQNAQAQDSEEGTTEG